jgi:hypothetical protein
MFCNARPTDDGIIDPRDMRYVPGCAPDTVRAGAARRPIPASRRVQRLASTED